MVFAALLTHFPLRQMSQVTMVKLNDSSRYYSHGKLVATMWKLYCSMHAHKMTANIAAYGHKMTANYSQFSLNRLQLSDVYFHAVFTSHAVCRIRA